jgi:Protein of unknown function (DUF3021).
MLAIIGTLSGAKFLLINSVFQSLAANIIIHLGYFLTRKFESEYVILEAALDIGYTIIVLIIFGFIFHWFTSTPIWMLVIMSIVIYIVGLLLSMIRIREEIDTINRLLKRRIKNQIKEV